MTEENPLSDRDVGFIIFIAVLAFLLGFCSAWIVYLTARFIF